MFKILEWLLSKSTAEKLLAKAFVCFEHGQGKMGLAFLMDGMAEMTGPGAAQTHLLQLKAEAISLGFLPAPAVPVVAAPPALVAPPPTE